MTLTSSKNPAYVNQSVTFSVAMTGTPALPTGTVTFKEGTVVLATVSLSNGQASFTKQYLKSASVSVSASYSGDLNFLSRNLVLKQVVNKHATSTVMTSSRNPSIYGQSVGLTATVTSSAPTPPAGKVVFKNGATTVGTVTLVNGVATLNTVKLPAGTLSLTGLYNGDTASNKSTSPAVTQTVGKAVTTTTVTSSLNPSTQGQSVKLTATVKSATTTPTGTVTFMAGSTQIGIVTLAGGKASITTSTLPKGQTTIKATYAGTANIVGSSGSVVQSVN
jgi:hypothetical protein